MNSAIELLYDFTFFSMYCSITWNIWMIAMISAPNAIDPKWYLDEINL